MLGTGLVDTYVVMLEEYRNSYGPDLMLGYCVWVTGNWALRDPIPGVCDDDQVQFYFFLVTCAF